MESAPNGSDWSHCHAVRMDGDLVTESLCRGDEKVLKRLQAPQPSRQGRSIMPPLHSPKRTET
eukprot:6053407-Amphidinium_carterae.1